MPAITADTLTLPRLPELPETATDWRGVTKVVKAQKFLEGEGFQVRRPFPGVDLSDADPFLLLDQMGAVEYGPGEAKGAPWHPHRGFETVTYMIDGAMQHTDSIGGGGLITDGSTQWMTAGAGILHNEMPPPELIAKGGLFHGVQLWVNLPRSMKMTQPRYQDIEARDARLLSSDDGGALVRVIAGELDGHKGPGSTYTPITYLHATLSAGARLAMPWPEDFTAMVYVLSGRGTVGAERRPLDEGHLAVFGRGEALTMQAADTQPGNSPSWEILVLGGKPINEPVARYGPFVMNTRQEILDAFDDYQAGRLGTIPAIHRTSSDEELT
ncbi:pirin family protein [Actinokineospora sp. HUAS TT18]|uniref:pirin family protein n=1 Tax=Actinokineospora sp. HUAS TT18 TaxID=3447451 RepID=UPI003F51CF97